MIAAALSVLALAIWIDLLLCRGWFWLCRERDDGVSPPADSAMDGHWPSVVAVIPARDESDMVAHSVGSLLSQDYRGPFLVVLVDDQSVDGTAVAASAAASAVSARDRLQVVAGTSPPAGWTGKLWAMRQGLTAIEARGDPPEFVLFSDADIRYAPHALSSSAAKARRSAG